MKIILATDGSEFSYEAAKKCCEMLSIEEDTEIMVLCVVETITPAEPFGMTDEYFAIAQKAAHEVASDIVEDTRQTMYSVINKENFFIDTKTVSGRPKQTIVDEAEEWGADLVVVGSHGRGFWGRVFLGSVSDAVVRHAHCSVMVVRKDSENEEDD